jgi:hypothetical protein
MGQETQGINSDQTITRILDEQRIASNLYTSGHPERDGLRMAMTDWVMEEVLETSDKRSYQEILKSKIVTAPRAGFEPAPLTAALFDWQAVITQWAIRKGRAALFCDTGLGKTPMQLEWALQVSRHTCKPVLILAPLAVSQQTKREGRKFGIDVTVAANQSEVRNGVNVTNYEKLHLFDTNVFSGVVLDESSIRQKFAG